MEIKNKTKLSKQLDLFLYFCCIVFLISMICSFRAVSSITIGLLILAGSYKNRMKTGEWLGIRIKNPFFLACSLFYFLQLTGLLYTGNFSESIMHLQKQSAVLLVPFAFCCNSFLHPRAREKLMKYYIWILATALLYCLLRALFKYCSGRVQDDVFFYHALVSPFKQHAVFVSVYVFAGLIYLLQCAKHGIDFCNKRVHFILVFYFTCCLLLLSSKLIISFSAFCLLYYFLLLVKAKLHNRFFIFTAVLSGLAMIILVMSTQNKISSRFNEILSGNLGLIEQRDFNPAIYFNGLQFRLLQWRFVREILTEKHAWLTGRPGDAQLLLDRKYSSTHMFTGNANSVTRGYLGYNTHNQFLESLLRSGIPGLLAFIFICYTLLQLAWRRQNRELTIIILVLIAYCFNESVLETQFGIMLFTFFPLFLYYGLEEKYTAGHVKYSDNRQAIPF